MTARHAPMAAWIGGSVVILLTFLGPPATGQVGSKAASVGRANDLIALGKKFDGAQSCANAKCHGAAQPADPPKQMGNEFSTWSEKDPHAHSFTSLTKPLKDDPKLKEIGKNLGIADVTTSERCTNCHTLNVPANLRGRQFNIREGNTCTNCHGPSETWYDPHAVEGWAQKQRQELNFDHDAMLKKWGLYDTKPVIARAEICVSCHVSIDADLVAAGHPQPVFELDFYSTFENFGEYARHWRDPLAQQPFFNAHLWAAGQVVAARDALNQLATRAAGNATDEQFKDAQQQAIAHVTMLRHLAKAANINVDVDPAKLAGDKAAAGSAAKAAAEAANKSFAAVGNLKPDAKLVTAVLSSIAGDAELTKTAGLRGAEQQALAIYSLYNSFAVGTNVDENQSKGVVDVIAKLFAPIESKSLDAEQFSKDLAEVKGKLPQ